MTTVITRDRDSPKPKRKTLIEWVVSLFKRRKSNVG